MSRLLPPPLSSQRAWPFDRNEPEVIDDPKDLPAIGIVTPSFNQGRFLEAAIRSVLLQGYPRLEYYIEDGGSTDETLEVIRHYAEFLSGWVSEKDRGQSHAINKGMARLKDAEVINWLNCDDFLAPGALRAIGAAFRAHPEASIVIGAARREIPAENTIVVHRHESVALEDVLHWHERFLSQPASWFRRELFARIGGVREDLGTCMDFDMWIRMFREGAQAVCIPDVLVTTIHHEDAKTVAARGRMYGETAVVLMEHGYREEAIRFVEHLYNDFRDASRFFRAIKGLPGGKQALDFYNKHLRR